MKGAARVTDGEALSFLARTIRGKENRRGERGLRCLCGLGVVVGATDSVPVSLRLCVAANACAAWG